MTKSTSVAKPPNTEKKLVETLNASILSLSEVHNCPICHDILTAPVQIPCHHIFCSLCIRRHLTSKSACPYPSCRVACTTVSVSPLRDYDKSLASLRALHRQPTATPPQKRLTALPLPGAQSRPKLVKLLSSVGLSTNGSVKTLTKRYKEYALRANSAADSAFATSTQAIADAVRQHEQALHAPQCMNSFFAAPDQKIATVTKGATFDDLVRQTAERRRKRKRASTAPDMPTAKDKTRVSSPPISGALQHHARPSILNQTCSQEKPVHVDSISVRTTRAMSLKKAISQYTAKPKIACPQPPKPSVSPEKTAIPHLPHLKRCSSQPAKRAGAGNGLLLCKLPSAAFVIAPTLRTAPSTPSNKYLNTQPELLQSPASLESSQLTWEQSERIRKSKLAAIERRRQNSQGYVQSLSFNITQQPPPT